MQSKKIVFCLSAGMLLALTTGCGEKKINLNNYISVSTSGIDMKGTASVDFDYEGLTMALTGSMGGATNFLNLAQTIADIKVCPNQSENLCNGDTVKVACSYDNDVAKQYNVRFTFDEMEIKVSGLPESTPVSAEDLLDAATITYEGVAPYAEAVLDTSENPYSGFVGYHLENGYDLENGDTIELSLSVDETYAENEGYVVIGAGETTKLITVEDLPQYAATYDDITDETLEKIKKQSLDVVEAWKADATYNCTFSATEPQRAVFLSLKDPENNSSEVNRVLFIYKTVKTNRYGSENIYLATELDGVIKNSDGTNQVDLSEIYVEDNEETYDELYNYCVKKRLAEYNVTEYEY